MIKLNNEIAKFFIIAIFSIVLISCDRDKVLDEGNFSMSYPHYFTVYKSSKNDSTFVLKSKRKNNSDKYIENISLIIRETQYSNFKELVKKETEIISEISTIIEKRELVVSNTNCLRLVFKGFNNDLELIFIQHFYVNNNIVYVLTFSCQKNDLENYYDDINRSLLSFKIR